MSAHHKGRGEYSALRDDVVWIGAGETRTLQKIHYVGFTVTGQREVRPWTYLAFLRSSEYSSFFNPIVRRRITSSFPVYT